MIKSLHYQAKYYAKMRKDSKFLAHRTEISRAWRKRNAEKYKAHIIVNNALRDGVITRPEQCENCKGTDRLHAHHMDYDKPLEVIWLCPICHKEKHD